MSRLWQIIHLLEAEYPNPAPLLNFENPFQLTVTVALSAQTTDAGVNQVSPELFRRWPTPEALAQAPPADLEKVIHSLGFFRQKAKNLIAASQRITEVFDGSIPQSMEDLLSLPGIGRKSANVIRTHIYGLPSIIVDTHFGRVCRRLGLTKATDPNRVEIDLSPMVPEERQNVFSMTANYHGRRYCHARKPRCLSCPLKELCPQEGVRADHITE